MSTTSPWRMGVVAGIFCLLQATPLMASENTVATVNGADTAWMIVATALVLFMTLPGLALFYGGLVRSKNVLSVLVQCFALAGVMTLLWVAYGYSLAFSNGGTLQKFIGGFDQTFLKGITVDSVSGSIPESLFVAFQMTFAIITPALIVGAFAERMKFSGMMLFSILWFTFSYLPICHMAWAGDGALFADWKVLDFAGGTVVHVNAGIAGLVTCLLLGPRKGFPKEPMRPHNLPFTVMGAGMLWVGWFGFNGGSELVISNVSEANAVAAVFVNTNAAAAGGVVAALLTAKVVLGRADLTMVLNGALAGLVSITAEPLMPSPLTATLIGAVGGVIVVFSVLALDRIRIDDPVGAISVHGVAGIWGLVAVPITNSDASLLTQLTGAGIIFIFVLVASLITWMVIKVLFGLRVSEEEEYRGVDVSECGLEAYPEFTKST